MRTVCIRALCRLLNLPLKPRYISSSQSFLPFISTMGKYTAFTKPALQARYTQKSYSEAAFVSTSSAEDLCDEESIADRIQRVESKGHMQRSKCNCSGCGAVLQSKNPNMRGFIPQEKLDEWLSFSSDPIKALEGEIEPVQTSAVAVETGGGGEVLEDGAGGDVEKMEDRDEHSIEGDDTDSDVEDFFPESIDETDIEKRDISAFICKRCFSLQHYNSALNITLDNEDYLTHLSSLKDKKALIILMLDVTDFPCCVFPNLQDILSPDCSVLIVANKIDLFPRNLTQNFWAKFRKHIISECKAKGLGDQKIIGVRFISVKQGIKTTELSEEIVRKWGVRGDIYLLGCTNVGKSSLFNKLLLNLCGSKPGELNVDSNLLTPKATISQWPGTTLGLLSFPLISFGKRRRLLDQQRRREQDIALGIKKFEDHDDESDDFRESVQRFEEDPREKELEAMEELSEVEVEDVLAELGLRRKKKQIVVANEAPQNKYWLHDTPGAINEAQLINYLSPKELTLGLPKAPIKPRTFILRPGQTLFFGGLARLDYLEGPVSAYFTIFSWSYLKVHATKLENADQLYERHLGNPESIFKLPLDYAERDGPPFPPLVSQDISIAGAGWKRSAADVVLSSVGWVAVTIGEDEALALRAHTPKGKGIYVRRPPLFEEAVNQRGKRERYGNRTAYHGNAKKWA